MRQSDGTNCVRSIGISWGIFFTSLVVTTERDMVVYIKVSLSFIDKNTKTKVIRDAALSGGNI